MRIALISDAWAPQVNGVVRTLQATVADLRRRGHVVGTITPDAFRSVPCPSYPDIRLALGSGAGVRRRLDGFDADAVHIATEGPLGWAARRWCLNHGVAFTTSFHTRFPDYLAARTGLTPNLFWPLLERFHRPAAAVLTATASLASELSARGLHQTRRWSRGVDLALFSPGSAPMPAFADLPRPILLYVGRVAVEKNVAAFLASTVPGSKVVVGDGPARADLERRFPEARFLGTRHGAALASCYAGADVLVFPSRTDTFGLVIVEALASGTPVAALPVPGPIDILGPDGRGMHGSGSAIGAVAPSLDVAIARALGADRAACVEEGRRYDWSACTDQFLAALTPVVPHRLAA